MPYTGSLAGAFASRHERATKAALEASAQELINGLKDPKPLGLAGGYTSGAFVSGNLLGSIQASDPFIEKGAWQIFVFTDVRYAEMWEGPPGSKWEKGHYNIFSRKVEQEKRWRPTLMRKDEDIFRAYERVYSRFMSR
jgi:hypothetical protein